MLERCWRQCMCVTHFARIFAQLFHRFYGSTNIQTFLYYKNFPGDQMFQKCAVSGRAQLDLNSRLRLSLLGSQGRFPLVCACQTLPFFWISSWETTGFWTRCTWSSPSLNSGIIWSIRSVITMPSWSCIGTFPCYVLAGAYHMHSGHFQ